MKARCEGCDVRWAERHLSLTTGLCPDCTFDLGEDE